MIECMPVKQTPDWLRSIASGEKETGLPLGSILCNSLYYPACGLNGTPVKFLGGNIHSFIYADYGTTRQTFLRNLLGTCIDCGFRGYRLIRQRDIHTGDLAPEGWTPPVIPETVSRRSRLFDNERSCTPFGHWSVWERKAEFSPQHGPDVFSFLFLGGEMSAVYQALYTRNGLKPAVLAIIQPGCMGGEWESVNTNSSFFKRVVKSNTAGMPDYLLNGGFGRGFYENPCWEEYQGERLVQLPERYAGLWKLSRTGSETVPGYNENLKNTVLSELLLTGHTKISERKEVSNGCNQRNGRQQYLRNSEQSNRCIPSGIKACRCSGNCPGS